MGDARPVGRAQLETESRVKKPRTAGAERGRGEKTRGRSRGRERYHEVVTQRRNGVIGYEPAAREPSRGTVVLEGVNWSRGIVLLREGDAGRAAGDGGRRGKGARILRHEPDGHCVALLFRSVFVHSHLPRPLPLRAF